MKRLLLACFLLAGALPAWAQNQTIIRGALEGSAAFSADGNSRCYEVPFGVGHYLIRWEVVGTVSAGTVKLVGSTTSSCASTSDIIPAQTATASSAVGVSGSAMYPYVQLVFESYMGTGTVRTFLLGEKGDVVTDPCNGRAKTPFVVNVATAAATEIANAVAGKHFYICAINLVAAAAQTIAFAEDDTDGCGSLTAGLAGGVTAATGWSFAANGGIALGNGNATVMRTGTAGRYLCFITGQAAQLSGTVMYVQAP